MNSKNQNINYLEQRDKTKNILQATFKAELFYINICMFLTYSEYLVYFITTTSFMNSTRNSFFKNRLTS